MRGKTVVVAETGRSGTRRHPITSNAWRSIL